MNNNQVNFKNCKKCGAQIPFKAKKCQFCGKKQQANTALIVIGVIVGFFVLVAAAASLGGDESNQSVNGNNVKTTEKKQIEYTIVTVAEMTNELNDNALKAEKKYQDQYLEITGRLSVIDSDGKYISLRPSEDKYAIIGVQCYIKNEQQKEQIMEMTKDDIVTVRGKIKSIGEIMGYSLDIDEIVQK